MGFNVLTLLSLPLGLIIPIAVMIFFMLTKKKTKTSFQTVGYGFLAFLASIVAVVVVFIAANALIFSGVRFADDDSGMTIAGTMIVVLIAILFAVCESFKMLTVNKFANDIDNPVHLSGVGFAAGVIIAQNLLVFVALNIFNNYQMEAGYAIFSGAIILVTGVMYLALSVAGEMMFASGHKAPAYAISSVYYLFWASAIIFSRSTVLLYVALIFFFIVSLALSGVFIVRSQKDGVK